jgi:hypothetical protein
MKFFLLLFLFLANSFKAQIPSFAWLKNWNSAGIVLIEDMQVNKHGHVYVVGYFSNTVDFDPGPGTFTLSALSINNGFILELDALGQFVWAGAISGGNASPCRSVDFDQQGNVYVRGFTNGNLTTDLDPGPGTQIVNSSNSEFLLKLNPLNQYMWAGLFGSGANAQLRKELRVLNGYIYCVGSFGSVADLDPGPAVHNYACTSQASPATNGDFFILKLDLNGNLVWAATPSSSDNWEKITSFSIDSIGNIYVIGTFTGTCDFSPSAPPAILTYTGTGQWDSFIAKYAQSGTLAWVKQFNSSNYLAAPSDILCHNSLVYFSATFGTNYDWDLGPGTFTLAGMGSNDCAYVAYDPSGNFKWAKQVAGPGQENPFILSSAPQGKIYSLGKFASTIDFDPGPAVYSVTATGNHDLFFLALDSTGNFNTVGTIPSPMGATLFTDEMEVTSEANGNLYLSGFFNHNTDFDFSPASYLAAPTSTYRDAYLLKMSLCPAAPLNLNLKGALYLCSGSTTTLTASSPSPINWYTSQNSASSIASGSVLVTPTLAPGSYTWYAAASACSLNISRMPVIVNVTIPPSVSVSASAPTVCAGNQVSLTAGGGVYYSWLPSGTGSVITVTPGSGNTTYTVIASDPSLNCNAQKTVQVQVLPLPPVTALASQPSVCAGHTVQLSANGAATYSWLPSGTGSAFTITATTGNIYTVTGTDASNCSASATVQVQVKPLPVLSIISPTLICNGSLAIFTASGADTYVWNNSPGTASYSFVANSNGTLNVSGTSTVTTCNASVVKIYTVSACTSINEQLRNDKAITIYPNPANGKIYFMNISNATFFIYDSKGMNLGEILIDNNGQADISEFAPGLYFIVFKDPLREGAYKIIKE